jgi:hypothetical protein
MQHPQFLRCIMMNKLIMILNMVGIDGGIKRILVSK